MAQEDKGRGQCLPEGGGAVELAVSAAVQGFAGGIQRQRRFILEEVQFQGADRSVFGYAREAPCAAQAVCHGFLHDALPVRGAHKLRGNAAGGEREGRAFGQIILPRDGNRLLVEFVIGLRAKCAGNQADMPGCAQKQIGARRGGRVPVELHPGGLYVSGFIAQSFDFSGENPLQTVSGGGDIGVLTVHAISILPDRRIVHGIKALLPELTGRSGTMYNKVEKGGEPS